MSRLSKQLEFRSPFARLFIMLTRDKLTRPGRFLFMALVLTSFMSMSSVLVPIYHLASALIAVACMALIAGFLMRPRILVETILPEKVTAEDKVPVTFQLTNRSRFTAYDISVRYFNLPNAIDEDRRDPLIPSIKPGETATITIHLLPVKRGYYEIPAPRPFTTAPFALMRTKTRCNKVREALTVLPAFHPAEDIIVPATTRYQPGGIALTSSVGESPEYIGNRDYRPGDPLKHIDFRSWARLNEPIVREYQEEYYCRIALIFDTYVPKKRRKEPPAGFDDFEAAVSLSASVADALGRGEYILDIFAAGPQLYVFRSGRNTAHFENVLEILACVEACRKNPFGDITPRLSEELANMSTVICIFLDWDTTREQLVRAAIERGCNLKAIILRDGPTTEPTDKLNAWADSVDVLSPEDIHEGRFSVL